MSSLKNNLDGLVLNYFLYICLYSNKYYIIIEMVIEQKTIRLATAAELLEVNTSTIVDTLNAHGFSKENKPNQKINKEELNLLVEKLAIDIDIDAIFSQNKSKNIFISELRIENFWQRNDIVWKFNPEVSILVGFNGTGKSTILEVLEAAISPKDDAELGKSWEKLSRLIDKAEIILSDNTKIILDPSAWTDRNETVRDFKGINRDDFHKHFSLDNFLIKTFDNPSQNIDGSLKKLERGFIDYRNTQIALVTKKMIKGEINVKPDEYFKDFREFIGIVNAYFEDTEKRINPEDFENQYLVFEPQKLSLDKLSSGEKQLLILLINVFLQHKKPSVLLLDEPEVSLHSTWQEKLFKDILKINPDCQIIAVTHSVATYSDHWLGHRQKIKDITCDIGYIKKLTVPTNTTLKGLKFIQPSPRANHKGKPKDVPMKDFLEDIKSKSSSDNQATYQVNIQLKELEHLDFEEATKLIDALKNADIKPDIITITTLLNRFDNFEDCERLLAIAKDDEISPNEITLNSMLKKADNLTQAIDFVKDAVSNYPALKFPDIITFSTLLGKVASLEDIEEIENLRDYYKVLANSFYLDKLNFKKNRL